MIKYSLALQGPESLHSHAGFYTDTKQIITAFPAGIIMSFPLLFACIPFSYLPIPFSDSLKNCFVDLHSTYPNFLVRFPLVAGAFRGPHTEAVPAAGTQQRSGHLLSTSADVTVQTGWRRSSGWRGSRPSISSPLFRERDV